MKPRIYPLLSLIVLTVAFLSCESDRNDNPTLQMPDSFIFDTPADAASEVYNLRDIETIELTCRQPDYGFTAAVTYRLQVAIAEAPSDEDFLTLPTGYTSHVLSIDAKEIAVALVGLLGIDSEEDYPTEAFPVHFRLQASLKEGLAAATSNTVTLAHVLGYFALDEMVLPTTMYLTGSFCNWDWTKAPAMIPALEGKFWTIQYFPEGTEIKFNQVAAWDETAFGFAEERFPATSVELAGLAESGGNILVNKAGWYIVVVTATVEGRAYAYTVEFLPPDVYLIGDIVGGWDTDDTNKFSVPDGEGEFISPVFTTSTDLRICIKIEDAAWWQTEFIIINGKITYRGMGGDQERLSVAAGQQACLNFLTGEGAIR
jgi:hypothetical protein